MNIPWSTLEIRWGCSPIAPPFPPPMLAYNISYLQHVHATLLQHVHTTLLQHVHTTLLQHVHTTTWYLELHHIFILVLA